MTVILAMTTSAHIRVAPCIALTPSLLLRDNVVEQNKSIDSPFEPPEACIHTSPMDSCCATLPECIVADHEPALRIGPSCIDLIPSPIIAIAAIHGS